MRVVTIGSCLSRFVGVWLNRDFGLPAPLNQVMHVNSEQMVAYYVDRSVPVPPAELLDSLIEHDPKNQDFVRLMIRNMQPDSIGLADFMPADLATRTNLISTLGSAEIDLFICDNLFDLSSAPYFLSPDIAPEYANSPVNIPVWLCQNYRELARKLRHSGQHMTSEQSAGYWVRIIDWLAVLQPKARFLFLCCPASTSRQDAPERAERAATFYDALMSRLGQRRIEVMPPRDIPEEFTYKDDWTHLHDNFYRSIAGHLYMTQKFGALVQNPGGQPG